MPYRISPAPEAHALALPLPQRYRPRSPRAYWIRQKMFAFYALGACFCAGLAMAVGAPPGVVVLFLGASVLCLFGHFVWVKRLAQQVQALVRKNDEALALLDMGHARKAEQCFDALVDAARGFPVNHSCYVLNRAVVRMKQGYLDEAIAHMRGVARGGCLEPVAYRAHCAVLHSHLALASALRGDVTEAARSIVAAHSMIAPQERASLLKPEAILEARKGNYLAAAAKLEGGWAKAEAVFVSQRYQSADSSSVDQLS